MVGPDAPVIKLNSNRRVSDEQLPTEELIELFLEKFDQHAAAVLVRRFQNMVAAIIAQRVPASQIEELSQEVFLDFFRSLPQQRDYSAIPALLKMIALRRCCDYWRTRPKPVLSELKPEQLIDRVRSVESRLAMKELLQRALDQLPERSHAIARLSLIEGLSAREIAEILNISIISTKVESFRLRKRLRTILTNLGIGDEIIGGNGKK